MKSHFTIRQAPKGGVFHLRLFLTGEDAEQYRYADRILVTFNGRDWTRYGYARQVEPRRYEGGWLWDCRRSQDKELLQYYGDIEPKERRYYGLRLTMEGIFVNVENQISKEDVE